MSNHDMNIKSINHFETVKSKFWFFLCVSSKQFQQKKTSIFSKSTILGIVEGFLYFNLWKKISALYLWMCHYVRMKTTFISSFKFFVNIIKNIRELRELGWMSHRVMGFWFLLNSLSIFCVFSSGFWDQWKSSCWDIPRTIVKFDYVDQT